MNSPVTVQQRGTVALIVIDNPPVNAISHAVRAGLWDAVVAADENPAIEAIVLHGSGRNFIAGADIREMDQPPREPLLNNLLLRIEACCKPVVAALHGAVLGGGLETALASHYRCATSDVQLGLPEVKLGLLPGAGGTQRLPRLIGAKPALDLMTSGDPINLVSGLALGLIDREIVEGDVVDGALAYARELASSKASPHRLRDQQIPDADKADAGFFAGYRKALPRASGKLEAVERIIQCVEAAVTLPFDAALTRSRELFEECRKSSQSAALRHLFFAERSSRGSGPEVAEARKIAHVAVLGAGTMGSGIAVSCATNGLQVTLIDLEQKALDAGVARIQSTLDGSVKKGRLTAEAAAAARARVQSATELAAAANADFVIEAVFESMSVKQEVFRKLDAVCKAGAVLATNTSTLDVDAIANATSRPQDVLGMHFFSPANIMKLVEIVRGGATSAATLATTLAVTRRIGKIGVVVGNCFGFVGNRMLYAYGRENQNMLLEGATPERIDRALEEWGMAMGPNAVGDLAGLDVGYRVRLERKDLPDDPRYFRVADMLAEMGRYGQKTGKGYYTYEGEKRQRQPDPEVVELIRAEATRLGVPQREIGDTEIVERCIGALVGEGVRILYEGIAASADDIDVIWVNGYGFPRTRGGPMFYGTAAGLQPLP
ncbi:MAG TPA: 3-hydroxyacyl-CoA dehydrogenase NAD-binding domain-containing protein [Steroidobacteraceae bacterium]|nr:3-hydroxyacyl-CoA dehydrogenase NAD-binding domain-containing protein [Steroidobacteraceae bacterium]